MELSSDDLAKEQGSYSEVSQLRSTLRIEFALLSIQSH